MWIFGNGELARVAEYYFNEEPQRLDSWKPMNREIKKVVGDDQFDTVCFKMSDLSNNLDKEIFIPIGYRNLNQDRERLFKTFNELGYYKLSFIHQDAKIHKDVYISKNGGNWIQENCRLQTGVDLGMGNILWQGAHLGHNCKVEDFCWITSGVIICSSAIIEKNCFIGANAVIGPEVRVGAYSIVSSLANLTKSVPPFSVIGAGHNNILDKDSREIKMK